MKYITNPINAFLLIKRASSDITIIEKRFSEQSNDFLTKIKHLQPEDDDLEGAVEGLIRLEIIYRLKSIDFARGIIDGTKTRAEMTAHDLFVIGEVTYKITGKDYFAEDYLLMSWEMIQKGLDVDEEVNVNKLLLILTSIYQRNGDYVKALATTINLIERNPGNEEYMNLKNVVEKEFNTHGTSNIIKADPYSDYFPRDGNYQVYKEEILYSQVCRGNLTKSPQEASKLKCRYTSTSAFSKLARFKVEEANLDPYVVLFIDVVSDSEIEFLKEVTKPATTRAKTFGPTLATTKSNIRVAKLASFFDNAFDVTKKLAIRVEVSFD